MDKFLTKAEAREAILGGAALVISRTSMGIPGSAHIGQNRVRRNIAHRLVTELQMRPEKLVGITKKYRLSLEFMLDEYETAIQGRNQQEINRLIVLIENEADRIGYTNHGKLAALHTMAEKSGEEGQ